MKLDRNPPPDLPADPLFDATPISLWLEDFSEVHALMNVWRAQGVRDIVAHLKSNPAAIGEFFTKIKVLKVNRRTLELYQAATLDELLDASDRMFDQRDDSTAIAEIAAVWNEQGAYRTETVNFKLDGTPLYIRLNVIRLPDAHVPWDRMLIAIEDLTEQHNAQARLQYLSTRDTLTALYNQTFFATEMGRLNREGPFPVSIIVADLNGLKAENDARGHTAGDAMLRRAAEILQRALGAKHPIARMGGDEFACLLSACDAETAAGYVAAIERGIESDRNSENIPNVSLSIGAHTCEKPGMLHAALREADRAMYEVKRAHYLLRPGSGGRSSS
jgi:diguanylate cyclase (GGDEF)-like protein